MAKVNPIPEGYTSVTPYIIAKGADKVIDFLKKTFNAEVKDISKSEDGTIMHASLKIGNGNIMLSEGSENFPPMPCMIHIYVDDVDQTYKRGIEAGGTSIRQPQNEFYGDRSGGLKDHSGNQWWIATHIEDVAPDEMKRRMEEWEKSRK